MQLRKEVLDYLKEGLSLGYSPDFLEREMLREGYSKREVKHYIASLDPEKLKRIQDYRNFVWIIITLGVYFLLVFNISILSDNSFFAVFFGFLPLLVSIIGSIVVIEYLPRQRAIIWTLPFFTAAVFFAVGIYGNFSFMADLDVLSLAIFNFVASILFVGVSNLLGIDSPFTHQILEASKSDDESQLGDAPGIPVTERIISHLRSLKESCEKLNLAVNKVYSDKNHASALMRNKIRILSSWLKDLDASESNLSSKKDIILASIKNIQERLSSYYSSENEIFHNPYFINLDRDPDGKSRIVDVLIDNTSKGTQDTFAFIIENSSEVKNLLES